MLTHITCMTSTDYFMLGGSLHAPVCVCVCVCIDEMLQNIIGYNTECGRPKEGVGSLTGPPVERWAGLDTSLKS